MAQITAGSVNYTIHESYKRGSSSDPAFGAVFNVTFGDGTATYTSGGVPLTRAKLGCPAKLIDLVILDSSAGDGILYKYNYTAETVQMYQRDGHTHTFIMAGGVTTTADFLYHSSGALGKAAATNVTIAGTSPATTGGVATAAAAAFSELSTAATVSATTLRMRVSGW